MWIDSHCHLTGQADENKILEVLARARAAGIEHFLTIACDVDELSTMLTFAKSHNDVSMTVGVHPHEASKTLERFSPTQLFDILKEAAANSKVVGLGEMGYDDYYHHSTAADQATVLDVQLQLAQILDLPISIHTREAEEKTLAHLKAYPNVKGVIHCFSGTSFLAKGALDLGYYLSLSGIITFPKAQELRDIVKSIPLEAILLETDSPFLAPVPYRGQPNEPAFLIETAAVLAAIKNIPLEKVAQVTTANFYKLFPKATVKVS